MRRIIFILLLCLVIPANGQFAPHQKPCLGYQVNWGHPLSKGLVGFWLFNEGSGNKVFDLSGNTLSGTFDSNVSWSSGCSGSATHYPQIDASMVDFGDVSQWEFAGEFTVKVKIKMISANNIGMVFGRANGSNGVSLWTWSIFYYPDFDISFAMGTGAASSILTDKFVGAANIWYDVVFVCKATTINLYVDGIYRGQVARTIGQTRATADNFYIHEGGIPGEWHGEFYLDHAIIWNRALSTSEIALLYPEPFCMLKQDDIALKYTEAAPVGGGQVIIIQTTIGLFLTLFVFKMKNGKTNKI